MDRILIIDDDRDLCELIARSVLRENIRAEWRCTGREGLARLREEAVQLVILDVMMPGMDGFETLERIRASGNVPVLLLTSKDDCLSKVRGLRAGADDYLTKPFEMDELLARVVSLIRRYTLFNGQEPAQVRFRGFSVDCEGRRVTSPAGTFELPPKEYGLLMLLARRPGRILTKKQIYEEVWGEAYCYDDANIMAVVSRLRRKLEPDPANPRFLQTVKGVGYRLNGEA